MSSNQDIENQNGYAAQAYQGNPNYPYQANPNQFQNYVAFDVEHGKSDNIDQSIVNPRIGFIRKVYAIISCQLLLTVFVCYLSMTNKSFFDFQIHHPGVFQFLSITSLIIVFILSCYTEVARQVPINYILLFVFTFAEAYLVGIVCALQPNPNNVIVAAGITLAMTFGLTIYAFTTKTDFTIYGASFFIGSVILFCATICFSFQSDLHVSTGYLFLCYLVLYSINICVRFQNLFYLYFEAQILQKVRTTVIFYAFYLIYDTQLIVGQKRYSLSVDDYVIAALLIYLDIIILFLKILEILGRKK